MNPNGQPSLLSLPRELRDIIYDLVLPTEEKPQAVSIPGDDGGLSGVYYGKAVGEDPTWTLSNAAILAILRRYSFHAMNSYFPTADPATPNTKKSKSDENPKLEIKLTPNRSIADHFPPLCNVSKQLREETTYSILRGRTLVLKSGRDIAALTGYFDSVTDSAAFAAIRHIHLGGNNIVYRWLDRGFTDGPGASNPDFAFLARCPQLESVTLDLRTCVYEHLVEMNADDWLVTRGPDKAIEKLDLKGLFECRSLKEVRVLYKCRKFEQWQERPEYHTPRVNWDKYVPSDLMEWMQKGFAERGLQVEVTAEAWDEYGPGGCRCGVTAV
ncbi:hypothetical protein BU16DRAFT_592475 [Lophium mytilinum]|uniref:F-box domain-containing protein n=1 Tax=Lophium mytilinum TaxID=390894 RepID=A0A6A6QL27_9PEZI|nr:hypothetical protein BU16DRAFT_592475 [Lophium mytilinum]